jgi:hypothetical protein
MKSKYNPQLLGNYCKSTINKYISHLIISDSLHLFDKIQLIEFKEFCYCYSFICVLAYKIECPTIKPVLRKELSGIINRESSIVMHDDAILSNFFEKVVDLQVAIRGYQQAAFILDFNYADSNTSESDRRQIDLKLFVRRSSPSYENHNRFLTNVLSVLFKRGRIGCLEVPYSYFQRIAEELSLHFQKEYMRIVENLNEESIIMLIKYSRLILKLDAFYCEENTNQLNQRTLKPGEFEFFTKRIDKLKESLRYNATIRKSNFQNETFAILRDYDIKFS